MAITTGTELSEVPALTIAEQTGDRRTLVLTQRALPYRPIGFSGVQRRESTSYAGNSIKTLQVLGPDEEPSEWSGTWKDRFIGDVPRGGDSMAYYVKDGQRTALTSCVDLVQLVDDIRRKGQEVVAQWGPEVRRGILDRFERKWLTLHDVQWTMRFEWVSQNDPDVPAVVAKDTDYANAQGTLASKVQNLKNLIATAVDVASDRISAYSNDAAALGSLVTQFQDTTTNALDTTIPVVDQQRRIAGIMATLAVTAADSIDRAEDTPAAVQVSASAPTGEGPVLAVESFVSDWKTTLRDMRFTALLTQAQTLKAINPSIIAAFKARAETDLRDVSTRYYRTPDEWRSLLVFNEMTSSRLESGDTVFVPLIVRPLDGSQ